MQSKNLLRMHPRDVVEWFIRRRYRRFYFVYDQETQKVMPSHSELREIADFLQEDRRDFMQHEGLFFQISEKFDTLQGAFVHKTARGQGAGGVRYWQYATFEQYLRDGLRLSKGMTRKNALAGLWWGGGKGVMAQNPAVDKHDPEIRASLYREFGELVTAIKGCYVTAEDVGTNVTDMSNIFSTTRFTTCIPSELGGSGNPSVPTARGVVCGLEGALEFLSGDTLAGKTVAVQGVGNVGGPLIGYLFERDVAKIIACDIDARNVNRVKETYAGKNLDVTVVAAGDTSIMATECDILSPCATGAILNPDTIPQIRAKIICGSANNQLEDAARDDRLLQERGIVYVPDFLANRMGIVNCCNEQYGYVDEDPAIERHLARDWEYSVHRTTIRVLSESRDTGVPPARVATRRADEMAAQPHPIFGHRGQQIIDSLIAEGWK